MSKALSQKDAQAAELDISQFKSIVDIGAYGLFKEDLSAYSSRINTSEGMNKIVTTIYYIIFCVGIILPDFFLDMDSIWSSLSILRLVFRIITAIYQGPFTSMALSRQISSACILVVFWIYFIAIGVRSKVYSRTKMISKLETRLVLLFGKYLIPAMCPALISSVPHAINSIFILHDATALSYFILILCPISFAIQLFFLHNFILVRVMFENSPIHEWSPIFGTLCVVDMSLNGLLANCMGIASKSVQTVLAVCGAIFNVICGYFVYYLSSLPNRTSCILIGSLGLSSACLYITQIVNFFEPVMQGNMVIIIAIIYFVVSFLILYFINMRLVSEILCFYDQCSERPEDAQKMVEDRYASSSKLVRDLRISLEQFHPFALTFIPFEYGVTKWPDNAKVLAIYGRVLAFFPNKTERMMEIAEQISKMKTFHSRMAYYDQFKQIANEREVCLTDSIKESLSEVQRNLEYITIMKKRFWEGVMQRNMQSFWDNSDDIYREGEKVERLLNELRHEYPRQSNVLRVQIKFVLEVLFDEDEAENLRNDLKNLKMSGRALSDRATRSAMYRFPLLSEAIQNQEDDEDESVDTTDDAISEDKSAFGEVIKKSKLGNVSLCLIFIMISTAGLLGFYIYFQTSFTTGILEDGKKQLNMLSVWGELGLNVAELTLYINSLSAFGNYSFNASTVERISPIFYSNGVTKSLALSEYNVSTESLSVTQLYQTFSSLISTMSETHSTLKSMYEMITSTKYWENMTIQELVVDLSTLSSEQTDEFNEVASAFMNASSYILSNLSEIESGDFSDLENNFNTLLVCTVLIAIFLVTMPFMLQLFKLLIQLDLISRSFSHIPNADIRAITKEIGVSSTLDSDSSAIAELSTSSRTDTKNSIFLIIGIFSSFAPMMFICLSLYYECQQFIDGYSSLFEASESFYPSFTYSLMSISLLVMGYPSNSSLIAEAKNDAKVSSELLYESAYSSNSVISTYYNDIDEFSGANISFGENLTILERFLSYSLLDSIDVIQRSIASIEGSVSEDYILSLVYYYLTSKQSQLIDIISASISSDLSSYNSDALIQEIVIILWQIASLIISTSYLLSQRKKIKRVLSLYQMIPSSVIIRTPSLLQLVENGEARSKERVYGFSNSGYILSKIQQGIFVMDRSLSVLDCNPSFSDLCFGDPEFNHDKIKEFTLQKLFKGKEFERFTQDIELALKGLTSLTISETFDVECLDGRSKRVSASVLFITSSGLAIDDEVSRIETIVVMIDDDTDLAARQDMLNKEQESVKRMLCKVMPESMINQMEKGATSIAFVCQSATIGQIRISSLSKMDDTTNETFLFYDKVFSMFDEEMKAFPSLSKVRTFAHTYIFAGGLLNQSNKPMEHAEQTIQFGLKALSRAKEVGAELAIGVHSGGPVVAGVMGMNRPSFQVISPLMVISNELKATAEKSTIQISRTVYELVYSAGFSITERGEMTLKSGERISTYVVRG